LSQKVARWIVYLILVSTTLAVNVNSFDSGMLKAPLLILLAGVLALMFVSTSVYEGRLELPPLRSAIPAALFLLLISASIIFSEVQWASVVAAPVWIAWMICFLAGTRLFHRHENLAGLLRIIAGLGAVVSLVGLIQFFFYQDLSLDFFIDTDRRIVSTLTNATYLSGYVVLLIPALLGFTIDDRGPRWRKFSLATVLAALVIILFLTSTRSSIVAFILSMGLFVLASRITGKKLIIAGSILILLIGATAVLSPRLVERVKNSFTEDPTSSLARRVVFWKAGLASFAASPLIGHGIGTYEQVMLQYRSADYWTTRSEDLVPHAHNEFIETASDLGVAGLLLFVIIVVTAIATRTKGPAQKTRSRYLRTGLICSVLALLMDNLANLSMRIEPIGATFWLFLGILTSFGISPENRRTISVPSHKGIIVLAGVGLGLFTFWYGGNELARIRGDGHLIRGYLADHAGSANDAIREYQKAVASDNHNLLAHSNLTVAYLKSGRFEDAIQSTRTLQSISALYPKSFLIQGIALLSLGRNTEALRAFDAEERLRNHPEVYFYRAQAYMALSDSAHELASLEQLLLASERSRTDVGIGKISRRVLDLARSEVDARKFTAIYERLTLQFPADSTIRQSAQELQRRMTTQTRTP
jgi:O-antigen ligase